MFGPANTITTKTTAPGVVLPFYGYAAASFLLATILLFFSADAFTGHHFHPRILAITHAMALGWGTMIILGASHQLLPVLLEGKLFSNFLAYCSFVLAGLGIPLLLIGFYQFDMGAPARRGGELIVLALLCYLFNLAVSISRSKKESVHALFVFTAAVWLLLTAVLGLALVYNFTAPVLQRDSVYYLPLHAHTGIVGWFLLLVIGVGSRLIPMFLISKYTNLNLLRMIYALINFSLLFYTFGFLMPVSASLSFVPAAALLLAVLLFIYYCFRAWKLRLRNKVDAQLRMSLLAAALMLLPAIMLLLILAVFTVSGTRPDTITLAYGFVIFFGWITAVILGMTFKTLPFIVWNKVYHLSGAPSKKSPGPRELFSDRIFRIMNIAYLAGFLLFAAGIFTKQVLVLKGGAALLLITAVLYTWNVIKVITHQPAVK